MKVSIQSGDSRVIPEEEGNTNARNVFCDIAGVCTLS